MGVVVNEAPAGLQSHASAKSAGANSNPIFISFLSAIACSFPLHILYKQS